MDDIGRRIDIICKIFETNPNIPEDKRIELARSMSLANSIVSRETTRIIRK